MTIEPLALEAIKARSVAAAKGPWEVDDVDPWEYGVMGPDDEPVVCVGLGLLIEPNAEFIAHAREDIPALIAEVERLRALISGSPTNKEHDAPTS